MTVLTPRCELGGGARQHPVSTTAVRGALMASLAERSASPWTATSVRDRPAGCSTCASGLCGALCGNGDHRRRPALVVCWWRSDGGADRRRAGDDGRNPQRRHRHDTRRHPTTSVSSWDGGRRLHLVSLALRIGRGAGGTERSPEFGSVNRFLCPHARGRARGGRR